MEGVLRETLVGQFRIARALLDHHLAGLTTEECLWHPARRGLTVRHDPATGRWAADWPDDESYAIGPPSAGWTIWHLGYWLSTALDRNFGAGNLAREDVHWPGDGPRSADWIADLADRWLAEFTKLDDATQSAAGSARWPYPEGTLAAVLAWSTVELTKNAAELGMARFLFAVREG